MALTIGRPAPSFTLPSSDGGTQSLAALRGSMVVVYFYPRDNTPGCTLEAQAFRDALPALSALGVKVFGVSKDSIASHGKFRDKYQLTFPLLTDADGAMLTAYGAWGEKSMYGRQMMGIIRSTVLIGADGKVLAHWPKVSVKGHVDEVVAAARAAGGGGAPATKTPAKKAPATKIPAKKAPATKTPATKTPATKTPATKTPAKKAPATKTPAKKR